MEKNHPIETALSARLRVWRRGLITALALRVGAWLLLTLALAAAFDLFLPIPSEARLVLAMGLPLVALSIFLWKLRPILALGLKEMAAIADKMRNDPRQTLLSAYELLRQSDAPPAFLQERAVTYAHGAILLLPEKSCRPRKILKSALIVASCLLGAVCFLILLKPQAVPTLLARLMAPFADVPPYSNLRFEITPSKADVIYGADLEVSAQITGEKLSDPVYLLTRYEGKTERADCFRGSGNVYTQKLEKVVSPVEFCFAVGKARSKWQPIHLLLEPRFALAKLTLQSPAYTRELPREIMLGQEEIKGIQGTAASLSITSNRPLSSGSLVLKSLSGNTPEATIQASHTGVHTVRFDWVMRESAELSIQIQDVQGTPAPAPLVIRQTVLPDEKPRLALHQPGSHSLATPKSVVPITGTGSDDFGLRRIDFVRGLQGYRERSEELNIPKGEKTFEFRSQMDLSALGVTPGQIIELYLEGRDDNPGLSGVQTSEISRIEIITEEEYGKMLRDRISLDELLARLQEINKQLDQVRAALNEAQEAKSSEDLQKSAKKADDAAKMLQQFAKDFPAFDMEAAMQQALAEAAMQAQNAADRMAQLQTGPSLQSQIDSIREQFENSRKEVDNALAQREELESVGRVFEQATNFMQLVEQQRQMANWISRLQSSGSADAGSLSSAADYQQDLRKIADQMPDKIREAAENIPDGAGYDKLKADALSFAGSLQSSGAPGSMEQAANSAANTNALAAGEAAKRAHKQLSDLLPPKGDTENEFGGLCQGQCQNLFPQGSKAKKTLAQALEGMRSRGQIGGLGSGGPADDGYVTQGFSPMQLPVFGPDRMRITPPPRPSVTSFGSISESAAEAPKLESGDQTTVRKVVQENATPASISLQQTPEKYRSAVRKYFSLPATNP